VKEKYCTMADKPTSEQLESLESETLYNPTALASLEQRKYVGLK